MLPLPSNVKLIVGTQPIAPEKLPHKLLDIKPDSWITLPFMSIDSIQNYLVNDKRILIPQNYNSDYYADIAEAFFKLTNGHPLHLIYSLEYALNNEPRLFPYDIEGLPACPHNDIREYYRELLSKIDDYGKQVLYTFVISEIELWKKNDLEECLTSNGVTDAFKYYNQVRHILFYDGYFVKAFHESIFVYIRENISADDKVKCLKYIQKWLNEQGEILYTDLYLPIINARLKEYSTILSISKSQIVEYFKKGYSINLITKFLAKAEQIIFFELKDFVKTTELRHIKTRVINLLDFNTYTPELFCNLHYSLYKNQNTINYLKSSINSLNAPVLVSLSDFCKGNDSEIDQIFKKIKLEYKSKSTSNESEENNLLYILANSQKIKEVKENFIEKRYYSGLRCLFNHICSKKRTEYIKEFISAETADYFIIKRLCLYAIDQCIDLSTWGLPPEYLKNPFLATVLYCKNKSIQGGVCSLDNSIVLKRKNEDYEYSGRCVDLENYFHSLFFEHLYNNLASCQKRHNVETYNGFENLITTLFNAAEDIANKIKTTHEVNIGYLLTLFENFSENHIINEVRWKPKYRVSKSSITKIIADLLIILNIQGNKLNAENLNKLINFKHFHEEFWIEDYIQNDIIYLSKDAVELYLDKEQKYLNENLQYTQERTDKYLLLANFAKMHGLIDEAKGFLDKAFIMAMGYCHHKDPLLMESIKIIEYCIDNKKRDFENIIKKITKIICGLEYITDEGSDYAKKSLMRLCCKYSYDYGVKYYRHLLNNEDWYNAEEALNEILEIIQNSDENLNLLLSTITSDTPFFKPTLNSEIVMTHKKLVGRDILKESKYPSSNNDFSNKQKKSFNYAEYPVAQLDEFVKQIDYSNESCLLDWLKHWRNRNHDEQILNYFDKLYTENSKLFIRDVYLDELFDISLKTEGKDSAYKWLIRSIIQNISWASNYSSWENTIKRFQIFKDLYKERWQEFILNSSESKYSDEFIIGASHLVYFLLLIEENNLADQLMRKFVDLWEEDMADLPLNEVDWL